MIVQSLGRINKARDNVVLRWKETQMWDWDSRRMVVRDVFGRQQVQIIRAAHRILEGKLMSTQYCDMGYKAGPDQR